MEELLQKQTVVTLLSVKLEITKLDKVNYESVMELLSNMIHENMKIWTT